jgi:hypothetical protein
MKHLKIIEAVGQYDNKQGVISAIKNYQDKKQGKPIKILVIHFPTYLDYSAYFARAKNPQRCFNLHRDPERI